MEIKKRLCKWKRKLEEKNRLWKLKKIESTRKAFRSKKKSCGSEKKNLEVKKKKVAEVKKKVVEVFSLGT